MPCPTCDHTMQAVGHETNMPTSYIYWCPRCGTMKSDATDDATGVGVPSLVDRCVEFGGTLSDSDAGVSPAY